MKDNPHPDYVTLLQARSKALQDDAPISKALFHLFSGTAQRWSDRFSQALVNMQEYYHAQHGQEPIPSTARFVLDDAAAANASYDFEDVIDLAKAYVTLS